MVLPDIENLVDSGSHADECACKSAFPVLNVTRSGGTSVSFASNISLGGWCCAPDWNFVFPAQGPMGIANEAG